MRPGLVALLAGLVLGLSGCFQSTTLVKVKLDGSGTVEQTTVLTPMFLAQAKGGGANPGGPSIDPAKAQAEAAKMGEGVTFVSAEKIKKEDGSEGLKAVYAFKDISKLQIDQDPGGGNKNVTFKFGKEADGSALLTIAGPPEKEKEGGAPKEPSAEEIATYKQAFKSLKFVMAVEVEGNLIKTSSPYRDGNTVTVMDVDMDQIMADPAGFKKFMMTQGLTTKQTAKALEGVKGVKLPTEDTLTVQFKAK